MSSSGLASNRADESWQSILDHLTIRAKKDGLIAGVKNVKGFENKVNKVRDSIVIRNKLAAWISNCAEAHYSKSGGIATRLRDEGNFKFRNREYQSALQLYNESVICAPEYGPELSLAFGNRSAALYHLGQFTTSLQDIDLAIKYRYPKNLEYKLHQRRGQCLNKLGRHEEAAASFASAMDSLKFIPKLTEEKRAPLFKDLMALQKETQTVTSASTTATTDDPFPTPPIVPTLGPHPTISGGASFLDLKTSSAKGRHVVTTRDVTIGEVLFSERPYSSVLLPEHYATHCHHCYKVFLSAIPCIKCTQARYCSEICRITSWTVYHQFECKNLDLLHSVGIAHLAQRTVLISGFEKLWTLRQEIRKCDKITSKQIVATPDGGKDDGEVDRYPDVFNLVSHVDDLEAEDLFQYTVTACLLASSLERRTTFFSGGSKNVNSLMNNLSMNRSDSSEAIDDEQVVFIAGVLLKHVTQLVCNASAIYEVGQAASSIDEAEAAAVVDNSQFRVAVALYPGVSLMNHSCDPSVINSFSGSRIIVRAIKNIPAGAEVFNCYGPHFRRHPTSFRQEQLLSQYHFTCDCVPCTTKEMQEFEERFTALKCHFCDGPIKNPSTEDSLKHMLPCYDCRREQTYSDRVESVFLAYDLYKKAMDAIEFGNASEAVSALQSCYQIRCDAMYRHHKEIHEAADQLARCFCLVGQFKEAAQYLRGSLDSVEERFGSHSIELGHELVKFSDVLYHELKESQGGFCQEERNEYRSSLVRALSIFELHYGQWNPVYKELFQKLKELDDSTLVPDEEV